MELFFCGTCGFYPLDYNSFVTGCVDMDVVQEHRAMQVFPLADNAIACTEKYRR